MAASFGDGVGCQHIMAISNEELARSIESLRRMSGDAGSRGVVFVVIAFVFAYVFVFISNQAILIGQQGWGGDS